MSRPSMHRGTRLARASLFTALTGLALVGCGSGQPETGTIVPETTQGQQANDNMEKFMESQKGTPK